MQRLSYDETIRRAAVPELMFAPDVALVLGVPEGTALDELRSGRLGPTVLVAGRIAVLRKELFGVLTRRASLRPKGTREILGSQRPDEFGTEESGS